MRRTDELTPAERIKLVEEALAFHEAYWRDPRPGSGVPTLADALEALRGMKVTEGNLYWDLKTPDGRDSCPSALLTLRNGGDEERTDLRRREPWCVYCKCLKSEAPTLCPKQPTTDATHNWIAPSPAPPAGELDRQMVRMLAKRITALEEKMDDLLPDLAPTTTEGEDG